MKFSEKLLKLRKESSLSQEELAEKLGVTRQTISKWELSQTTPDMDKLSQISNVFGISVDDLLNDTESSYQKNNSSNKSKIKNKNTIVIVLVIVIIALLGFAIFISFNNKNNNPSQTHNTGIFGWFLDLFDQTTDRAIDKFMNITDKMKDKYDEWEEKDKENNKDELFDKFINTTDKMMDKYDLQSEKKEKNFEEKTNQMFEDYQQSVDKMNEQTN